MRSGVVGITAIAFELGEALAKQRGGGLCLGGVAPALPFTVHLPFEIFVHEVDRHCSDPVPTDAIS